MPAYNAEKTLIQTYDEIPKDLIDEVILVDDYSKDNTAAVAKSLNLKTIVHDKNKGYGGNQKTCYQEALKSGADYIVMLHPDYQYTPKLIPALVHMLDSGNYDLVLASRILGNNALKGGMPLYKYIANRFLTLFENLFTGAKLSEYHTGYRAYSKKLLETIPYLNNSDDFIFDNELIVQSLYFGFSVGEISCPTKYAEDSSSINFVRSSKYGLEVLLVSIKYFIAQKKIYISKIFKGNC